MSNQAAVTTYFTRKRKRDSYSSHKLLKLNNGKKVSVNLDAAQTASKSSCHPSKSTSTFKQNAKLSHQNIKSYFKPTAKENKSKSSSISKVQETKVSAPCVGFIQGQTPEAEKQSTSEIPVASPQIRFFSENDSFDLPLNNTITCEAVDNLIKTTANQNQVSAVLTDDLNKITNQKVSKVEKPVELSGTVVFPKVSKVLEPLSCHPNKTENMQHILKNKNKLKDLQDTLSKIKDLKEKRKILSKQNEAKSKTIKVNNSRSYAYSKYHSLAQKIPEELILPYKYKLLLEFFQSLDTIVSMLYNRQEIISWNKVEHSVKEITRKKFDTDCLSQIKHVYPNAFVYRQESNIITFCEPHKRSKYELTLLPLLDERQNNTEKKMTGSMLTQRRHYFHLQLLNLTKKHHQDYLRSMQPPIEVDNDDLKRWHPQFPLDMVPDVPFSDLPSPPDQGFLQCRSAKEVFEKTRVKLTKKAADALSRVALLNPKSSTSDTNNNIKKSNPVQEIFSSPSVSGISKSLLDKIRKKEAEKNSKLMLRSKENQEELIRLKNLPDLSRALRSLFVTEKKMSLPMEYLCLKLSKSCALVPTSHAVDQHLRQLATSVSSWFALNVVRGVEYGRLVNKQMQMSDVVRELESRLHLAESV